MKYQVFISVKITNKNGQKTEDLGFADKLYKALKNEGITVFLSSRSIKGEGTSNYQNSINTALDNSQNMIIVATKPEHINARWLKYESNLFQNEILSGRKPNAEMFLFLTFKNLAPLPIDLRNKQSFYFKDDYSFNQCVNNLVYSLKQKRNHSARNPKTQNIVKKKKNNTQKKYTAKEYTTKLLATIKDLKNFTEQYIKAKRKELPFPIGRFVRKDSDLYLEWLEELGEHPKAIEKLKAIDKVSNILYERFDKDYTSHIENEIGDLLDVLDY